MTVRNVPYKLRAMETTDCLHSVVKCLCCGIEASPASLIGKGKKKTMSAKAAEQRKMAANARWNKKKEATK